MPASSDRYLRHNLTCSLFEPVMISGYLELLQSWTGFWFGDTENPHYQISRRTSIDSITWGNSLKLPGHLNHFLGEGFLFSAHLKVSVAAKSLWGALAADPIIEIAELATERFWFCCVIGSNSLNLLVLAFTAVFAFLQCAAHFHFSVRYRTRLQTANRLMGRNSEA